MNPDTPGPIGPRGPGGGPRNSGRIRGQGVEPIAAQAAAAAQVRTYRDNGLKHSSSAYNRVCSLPSTFLGLRFKSCMEPRVYSDVNHQT